MVLGFILGIIGSLIASVIFLRYVDRRDKRKDKEKYGSSAGSYTGYGIKAGSNTIIDKKNPLSHVRINHLQGNLLELILKEINHPHEWHGLISMQTGNYGVLTWRYFKLHGNEVSKDEHQFGVKKFVFFPKDNLKVAYLIDESQGFGREILIEDLSNTSN